MGRKAKHTPEEYRNCAKRGLSKAETAEALGVTWKTVNSAAQMHRIKFRRGHKSDYKIKPENRAKIKTVKKAAPASAPIFTKPLDLGKTEKAFRMHNAGHPPGVIADYTGLSRGEVVMLVESVA